MTKQDVIERILKVAINGHDNYKAGDVERCNHCTSVAVGMVKMLDVLGIDGECGTWQDGAFHRIGYISIDGVEIIHNSEVTRAYGDAVVSDWAYKIVTVTFADRE